MVGLTLINDGEYTKTIYTMIREQRFMDAINVLGPIVESNMMSRAGLSLLGYCYYQTQDFLSASHCYQQLTFLFPDDQDYQTYYSQSLHQAGLYPEALKACSQIEHPEYQNKVTKLQAAIKFGEEDLLAAKSLVERCSLEDADTIINQGCIFFKEGRYSEALRQFNSALQMAGFDPHLLYSIALCHYKLKEFAPALKYIADIIERGIRDHPELSVGMATEGMEVRSVGNSLTLHSTALVEAFNLKAATEYQLKNYEGAREALTDMPPRSEEEWDAVTLHNLALLQAESQTGETFQKLQFLLAQNPPFPPETFANLLILYCKHEYFDMAADVLAEYAHLTYRYLSPYLYETLEALITQQTSPEEAYGKFDVLAARECEGLRRATGKLQDCRRQGDEEGARRALVDYEETMDRYVPVLMAQAKIPWEREDYSQVEKLFRQSVEFCGEQDVWRLNVAHTLFMQESKFKEATGFYEPLVKKHYENILGVSAVVLANLCVCYLLTSQNEEAEELLRKLEKEEEHKALEEPKTKFFHLSIVNLVIGTLYCAKGNYEFGISRVIKSLEPFNQKLGTDTWFYAKRCLLSLLENLSKHVVSVRDSMLAEVLQFLDQCQVHGHNVRTVLDSPLGESTSNSGKYTVTYEARHLKALLLQIQRY